MSFFKGLLFGSTLGGIGGLLFAPRKGSETQEKWMEPIVTTIQEGQQTQADYQQVVEDWTKTQVLGETLLPTFQKEMKKDIEAFKFQVTPRITRINEHLKTIQQHLEDSSLKKTKE